MFSFQFGFAIFEEVLKDDVRDHVYDYGHEDTIRTPQIEHEAGQCSEYA